MKTGKMWRFMKEMNNRFLLLIVMAMVLCGCKQVQRAEQLKGNEEEAEGEADNVNREGIYALPGDYNVDFPMTWWHTLIRFAGKGRMWLRIPMKRKTP